VVSKIVLYLHSKLKVMQTENVIESKVVNPLSNDFSKKKSKAKKFLQQNRIKEEIAESGLLSGIVPSLAYECDQEEILKSLNHNFKFLMIDNDVVTYKKMVNIALEKFPDNPPCFHLGNLSEIIFNAKENDFTHCLFDYCKGFEKHRNEVVHTLQNKIVVVGGLVFFTFCLRNPSHEHTAFVNEMTGYSNPKMKLVSIKTYTDVRKARLIEEAATLQAYRTFLLGEIGNERCWRIKEIETYRDGAPMALIILKRVK